MLKLLILFLFIMLIIDFILCDYSILEPSCVAIEVTIISAVAALLNQEKWQLVLLEKTVVVIVFGLMAFCIGDYFLRKVYRTKTHNITIDNVKRIEINNWWIICCIILSIIYVIWKYDCTYKMALNAGFEGSKYDWVTIRNVVQRGSDETYNRWCSYAGILMNAFSFGFLYVGINNILYGKFKTKDILLFIPLGAVIINIVLGPSRFEMISVFSGIIFMLYVLYVQKKGTTLKGSVLFLIFASCALLVFYFIFMIMGKLKGENAINSIMSYTGQSIPMLNEFIKDPPQKASFGSETLYGIRSVLQKLGFGVSNNSRHLEFRTVGNLSGNVYTVYRRLIQDYGYIGMMVLQFMLGAFFSLLYQLSISKRHLFLPVMAYAYFSDAVVMQGIDEIMLSGHLSIGTVYYFCFVIIFYFIFIKSSKEDEKDKM